jgi:hypothetical protein
VPAFAGMSISGLLERFGDSAEYDLGELLRPVALQLKMMDSWWYLNLEVRKRGKSWQPRDNHKSLSVAIRLAVAPDSSGKRGSSGNFVARGYRVRAGDDVNCRDGHTLYALCPTAGNRRILASRCC